MYYVIFPDGQQGPYHIGQIKSMCVSGELTPDALCWTEPWPEWHPVSDVITDYGEPRVPRRESAPPLLPKAPDGQSPPHVDATEVGNASVEDLLCCRCGVPFTGKPKKTFFVGLRKFMCGACEHQNTYPPTRGTTVAFAIILILFCLISISILMQGDIPFPGLLVLVSLSGLVAGSRARKSVKASRQFFRDKGR